MIDIQEVICKEFSLQRWNELGFTEGFDGDKEKELAMYFESIAQPMMDDKSKYNDMTQTVAFPIAKRLFIIKDYLDYILNNPKVYIDKLEEFTNIYTEEAKYANNPKVYIDKEAESCVNFCAEICDEAIDFFNERKNKQ